MAEHMQFRDLKRQYEYIRSAIDANIADVISHTSFISGEPVRVLESTLAEYVGVRHCVSVGNGTDAITIALRAMLSSVPENERQDCAVFVPDFTFFSTGECPAALGIPTYFVDVRKTTYNMDPIALEQVIQQVKEEGQHRPTVVIAVDLFGQPAEYVALRRICDKHGLLLLEDSAQGFGGRIGNRQAGSFADIATTSFFPAKPLGCYGDGGAIFTDNDEWASLVRSIAVHGKNADDKYDNVRLGYNSRLDTIQAAVLNAKFPVFRDEELEKVNKVADWYHELLASTSLVLPVVLDEYYSSWAQYTVQLPQDVSRDDIQWRMEEAGIPTMVYYKKPMHRQGAFRGMAGEKCACPVTEKLCERVLCLPIHPYLERNEVERVCGVLMEAIREK